MKRSEMLDHIKEDLLEKLKHRWLERGETDKWAEFTANQLLDMIEGFGMLPPLHIFEDQHESYCATYDNDECTCNPFRDNQWEPEDD